MPQQPDTRLTARLHHLGIQSGDPARLAEFYSQTMNMRFERHGERLIGVGPMRCLVIEPGHSKTLSFAGYEVKHPSQLEALSARLDGAGWRTIPPPTDIFADGALALRDPDGNALVFGIAREKDAPQSDARALPARLQHIVVASRDCARIADFYRDVLGFTLSDNVVDADRQLKTAFLRCGSEHHDFAVFQASENRLDHHCYEAGEWNLIRDWSDHMAALGVRIQWGPGRHGPGNNLFVFVHDPDGNWVEISAELERVAPDRPVGEWPHEQRTLNLWGSAPLRS
jgi:catechol 2,3-dioxygenase